MADIPSPQPKLSKEMLRLLRIKREMERREPRWMAMNEWYQIKLQNRDSWRRPKGLDNKIRHERKGYPARVKVGYRKPKLVRGLHPSGFVDVLVHNVKEIEGLDPSKHAIRIASTVGKRKRLEIIKVAVEKGFRILNLREEEKKFVEELLKSKEGSG